METQIQELLTAYPTLTQSGFCPPMSESDRVFYASRIAYLLEAIPHLLKPRSTLNTMMGSYGLKHYVERHIGGYVSNGELIVAMLLLEYKMKRIEDSPNCFFNHSLLCDEENPVFKPVSKEWTSPNPPLFPSPILK